MINDYRNPIGSVQVQQDKGSSSDIEGWRSTLNQGSFSLNNPYLENMRLATGEDDKNRWYQAAVQWEADNYNTQESREYNSPANQIALQREAGINPDIAGTSGSSGSSGSASGATIPQQQHNTDFVDTAERANTIINGVTSMLNTVSSFGQSAISAFDTLKTLPARSSLLDTQAQIAKQTMPATIDATNASLQGLKNANISSSLDILGSLSTLFTDKSTDADIDTTLSTLGYSGEDVVNTRNALRHYQSNPALQAMYSEGRLKALNQQEQEKVYTPELIGRLVTLNAQLEESNKLFAIDQNELQSSINRYLLDNGYGAKLGENMVEQVGLSTSQTKFSRKQLERDIKAYAQNIEDVKYAVLHCKTTISQIYANARSEKRQITSAEQAIIDSQHIAMKELNALGSKQLTNLYSIARNATIQRYMSDVNMVEGQVEMTPGIQKHKIFLDYTFSSMISGDTSTDAVVSSILSMIPVVGGVAQNAYEFNNSTQNINNQR